MTARSALSTYPRATLLAAFVLLAVVHTWPLARYPTSRSRLDSADGALNAWIVSWVAHTLPRHPTQLFNAPIFHPSPLTLAYSEPLIVEGVIAMPVRAVGGSPALAFNVVLLAGLALTGWAVSLFAWRITSSLPAAVLAGSAAAFNAHTLMRLPHLQALHLEFLPLALLALDRLTSSGRARDGALIGLALALQALASIYALVFTGWAIVMATMASVRSVANRRRFWIGMLAAAAVAALMLAPLLYPYYVVSHQAGLTRNVHEAERFSSTWRDYLFTGARVHYALWSSAFSSSADANFPGILVSVLAALGLVTGWRDSRHIRIAAAVTVASVLLSMLPRMPGFAWAHDHIAVLSAIRGYSRAGQIALVGAALLAAHGLAHLQRRCPTPRAWWTVAACAIILVNLEALRAPIDYAVFAGIPRIYEELDDQPAGAVLELPIYGPGAEFHNAPYMVNGTEYWRPLVNGYSGFLPPDYAAICATLHQFPDAASLAWLRSAHVTTVVLHRAEFARLKGESQLTRIDASPDLAEAGHGGDIEVMTVKGP